jgi:hypothetical protein
MCISKAIVHAGINIVYHVSDSAFSRVTGQNMDFENEGKKGQWNLKKYILLRVLLSTFIKDAIFWDVERRRFIEVSKETVA